MKIIIAGIGKIGANLTRQLSIEGYDITVIDTRGDVLQGLVDQYDVIAIHGNCVSLPILLQAGVEEADLLIVTTDGDEKNLLCCMTAQGINRQLHTIARIRNPEYSEQMYGMRDVFSLSMAINPERQAAREIERQLRYPGFIKRETFARGRVEMVELRLEEDNKLCGVALSNISSVSKANVLVCIVLRNGKVIIPDGTFELMQGDRIFVTASNDQLSLLLRDLGIVSRKINQVMICGGGRVGSYLAQALSKGKFNLRVIEQNREQCHNMADLIPNAHIIHGDASDQAVLEREGLTQCDAIISLTGMDEMNMIISMHASKVGVPHVITKLSRMSTTNALLDGLRLGSVVSPREHCCNTVVRYVRAMENQTGAAISVHAVADGRAEALEFLVEKSFSGAGIPIKKLTLRPDVLIAAVTRGMQTELAEGNSRIEPGDVVIVVKSGDTVIHQLSDILL